MKKMLTDNPTIIHIFLFNVFYNFFANADKIKAFQVKVRDCNVPAQWHK